MTNEHYSGPRREERYILALASGEQVTGTKNAVREAHWGIWRAEPTTECAGETWRAYAEKLERQRFEAATGGKNVS